MKDLGPAKKILGMSIGRERDKGKLKIHQKGYLKKLVFKFLMGEAKPVSVPLASHFQLSSSQGLTTDEERADMNGVPYSSAVGSVMYSMVSTRSDLANAISVLSRFMSNLGKEHWNAMKW